MHNSNGHLLIRTGGEITTTSLDLAAGKLTGRDHGEWGGELLYQGKRGKPLLVKKGNIRFIFEAKGQVYFIEGLSHMSYNRGALYQLTGQAPRFGYTKLVDFDDAPAAFAFLGEDLLIVQSHSFTVLHNLQPEVVLKNTFWGGLYPNSIAVLSKDEVYVGIRGGYVQVDLATKTFKFYQL